jgi:hypothetical protein
MLVNRIARIQDLNASVVLGIKGRHGVRTPCCPRRTVVRLMKPGGLRAVVAESALTRHQLLILNRSRKRAPKLRVSDHIIAGFHQVLKKRKYRMLFSSKSGSRPGPNGPAPELIDAVVEMKLRNPAWGCPRIAQQIALAFGVDIDKDEVRRILGKH